MCIKPLCLNLAKYRNSISDNPVIPERVITRPPSAELRPDQKDQILYHHMKYWMQFCMRILKKIMSQDDIIAKGFDAEVVAESDSFG